MIHTDGAPTIASEGTAWHEAAAEVAPRVYHAVICLPRPSQGDNYIGNLFASGNGLLRTRAEADALAASRNSDPAFNRGSYWMAVTWT